MFWQVRAYIYGAKCKYVSLLVSAWKQASIQLT